MSVLTGDPSGAQPGMPPAAPVARQPFLGESKNIRVGLRWTGLKEVWTVL